MTAVASLDDRYGVENGSVFLTGIQALVRLPIAQRQRDRAAGLDTAGHVSGYRGSPLAGIDKAFWEAGPLLAAHDITVQPAINEEMAATILIGTQQAAIYPNPRRAGVFGLWYGKGPGLDRASDALKHANSVGSSAKGGVLVVAGDDHGAVSSSMAHQSEQLMMSWLMPVLNPASVGEYIELGLMGWAMSRFSGCWIGFKAVTETVESASTLSVSAEHPRILLPQDFAMPPGGLNIRGADTQLAQEERLHRYKLPAALAFARANRLDRIVLDSRNAHTGIVATGKAYTDLRQAMQDLGIDDAAAARLGLRLYKVALSWPLEPQGALEFARGLERVLVIEEKRGVIEPQLKELLYGLSSGQRPEIHGKTDPAGRPLLPTYGELDPEQVAKALISVLDAPPELASRFRERLAFLADKEKEVASATQAVRQPYFCSGCPHNTSTKVPSGHQAFAGTGCHLMALWMDRNTTSILQMGAEGANWIGMAPYAEAKHIFQNLGDGTYVHSGAYAIRQAVAAGATMTYKILFNDAVAMTGGQPVDGGLTVPRLTQQLHHEGVARIAVVTDHPEKYEGVTLAPGATVHDRRDYDAVQRQFAALEGVTAIVYDQVCAAEKRRRLRRARQTPPRRAFINTAVCEGCNDCVATSNCLALKPVPTPFGLKRAIDQSACNTDFACVEALCPAIVTVEGALRRPTAAAWRDHALPAPKLPALGDGMGILITGIGGTGVVTIGQLLGWAAHVEGKAASVLDFTGLSQKGGGVLTHVRLAPAADMLHSARLNVGAADVVLAGDMVVTAGAVPLARFRRGKTRAIVNDDIAPTAATMRNPAGIPEREPLRRILGAATDDRAEFVPAAALAEALLGDTLYTNIFLLGFAWQKGLLPLSETALHRAIELNGREVEENKRAFAWGRLAAHDATAARQAAGLTAPAPETLDEMVARRAAHLAQYQDAAYAERYRRLVATAAEADRRLWGQQRQELTRAVASGYHRLLAYKDEYEVARLLTGDDFADQLGRQLEDGYRVHVHLASPFDREGRPRKGRYGPWALIALRLLAPLRRLRGTAFDPFGAMAERRTERRLIAEYETNVGLVLTKLSADNYETAVALAALPEEVRGFGSNKMAAIARASARKAALLARFNESACRDLAAE